MSQLRKTPLHDLHQSLGARMVPFAGYEMPVQFPDGVLKEHLHTRASAGLFDVSHMGQITVTAPSGLADDAALALETLIPVDILGLVHGRQRYGFFTNDIGGILDDLMMVKRSNDMFLVVNAARKSHDLAHLKQHLGSDFEVADLTDRALLALQGPVAEQALGYLVDGLSNMRFLDAMTADIDGVVCWITRSGYTGEDGFEISMPSSNAQSIAKQLLQIEGVAPVGLGARDSLRLEAGLCLYGHDIDEETTPIEAGLGWAIQKSRRSGARRGGFPGDATILAELDTGPANRRVGLIPEGRAPMREGVEIFADATSQTAIGTITSGGFGPSVGGPVSMAYVPSTLSAHGTGLSAEVRGKRLPVTVTPLPFVPANFKR